jgi:hypothetical protein
MVKSKSTYPKWHFGQVGHGGKKTYTLCYHLVESSIGGPFFFIEISGQKSCDFLHCAIPLVKT